jgi:hypothetical protein
VASPRGSANVRSRGSDGASPYHAEPYHAEPYHAEPYHAEPYRASFNEQIR